MLTFGLGLSASLDWFQNFKEGVAQLTARIAIDRGDVFWCGYQLDLSKELFGPTSA
jgi:hypothetical protein